VKIGNVTKLLESIANGLAGLSKDTASGLSKLHADMQPFHEQTVEQFAQFLRHCEEYQRTGIVPLPTGKVKRTPKAQPAALSVSAAADMVRSLLAEIDNGTVDSSRITALLDTLKKELVKPQKETWLQLLPELKISGKPKTIAKAIEEVRQMLNSQLEMHVKQQAF
jgi:hypothetical protein